MAIKVVIIYMMGQMEFDIEHGGDQCLTLAGSVDHVATNVLGIRYENLALWVCNFNQCNILLNE